MPRLSVIVMPGSTQDGLELALSSIAEQDLPAADYEVIVVAASGTVDQNERLRGLALPFSLRIVETSTAGIVTALNESIAASKAEFLLFTEADLILDPGNFRAHLESHGIEQSLVVRGRSVPSDDDSLTAIWSRRESEDVFNQRASVGKTRDSFELGANHSIRRATLLSCGLFDTGLPRLYREDMAVRLSSKGIRFRYEPSAGSRMRGKTADQVVEEVRKKRIEEIALLEKHPQLRSISTLAKIADAPIWKQAMFRFAAASPISPDPLLRPIFALADSLRSFSPFRKLGLRLLTLRATISFLRGASERVSWREIRQRFGARLPVLMYHHVGPPQPDSEPSLFVSAERFAAQLRYLKHNGYVGIRNSDWVAWLRDAKPLPPRPVMLTFDDAIADLHESAFPALERYGFPATVFVPTNCVGKGNLWNYSLGYKWRPCLTAEQIHAWSTRGIEFGAHSRNHPDLTTLAGAELEDEVAGSKTDLEKIIESPVTTFAYPYGPHNDAAVACVGRYFDLGFTTDEGMNTLFTDPSLLRRVTIFDWDTFFEFGLMLRFGWNPIRRLRGLLRIRTRFTGVMRAMRIRHS